MCIYYQAMRGKIWAINLSIYTHCFVFSSLKKMMLSFHEEEEGLPDSFLSKFPSLIKVDIHAKVTDPSVAKSMMGCLLSSLKANGK